MGSPFETLKSKWMSKIRASLKVKQEQFGDAAEEGMRFFNGPYQWLYGIKDEAQKGDFVFTGADGIPKPRVCMTVNKVAEGVQLFGPVLYHRNPDRKANPREIPMVPPTLLGDPNDPMVQQMAAPMMQEAQSRRGIDQARAALIQHYLQYTPTALDLKTECRDVIDETLITGAGVLWTEVYQPKGANWKLVGSFWDSIDNLTIDPDGKSVNAAKWVARKYTRPVWEVEAEFGLEPGSLQGQLESYSARAVTDACEGGAYARAKGETNDLIVYWKVYSKMGMGSLMSGIDKSAAEWDRFGQNVMLVVSDACAYPLNLPPGVEVSDEEIQRRVQWETPFWMDDAWPFKMLAFHRKPGQLWPISHFSPAMGELKFLNWAYSFIASKMTVASRDLIACKKSIGEEVKRVLTSGQDYEMLMLDTQNAENINQIVQFLQHPPFQRDIWTVIEAIERNFEKRVGLTELMYGQSAVQMRSASEAQVKSDQLKIRPDDMANKVEDFMSEVARQEALAARWHLEPQTDIKPIMGDVGAYWWEQLVSVSDPSLIIHQLEYRIEAGSIRKPNKDKEIADTNQAIQTFFPFFSQLAMSTGQVQPLNELIVMWGQANDKDVSKLLVQPPPPPPPMMPQSEPGQEQPSGGGA